jgi:hypothetical protein
VVAGFWTACGIARWSGASMFSNFMTQLAGCVLLTLFFLGWWSFHRSLARGEKLAGLITATTGGVLAAVLSPAKAGGLAWILASLPWVFTVWALWLLVARRLSPSARRSGLVVSLALTWGAFTLIRFEGLSGDGRPVVRWRWSPTSESRYLAERARDGMLEAAVLDPAPDVRASALGSGPDDWPGFRGPDRGGEARGLRLATDWSAHPPELLWRRKIGPAWSSLSVVGGRLFTQEQQGESEAVVCLDADSGRELWAHLDAVRFEDDQGGAGPRATPTFAGGSVFALGATGHLNCLDARTGARVWTRDVAADSGAKTPIWGFASSPLVIGERVVVFAGGDGEKSLRAYEAGTGQPLWSAPGGADSYSSPQAFELEDRTQILFCGKNGLNAVDPASGELLWRFAPGAHGMLPPCLQPHAVESGRFLVADETGTTALEVRPEGAAWRATELWSSRALKPSFDDFVVHDGFLYGFDAGIFCCVDARSGERRWKDGRYGYGQVLLVPDAALLLVAAESGEAVLLAADPAGHRELGRFQALTGKTWNHPVIARGRLYLRNGEELACFRLAAEAANGPLGR